MADHASLLRQMRRDARPYVEQLLDLKEVFSGFQKLASENGLDWGAVKALLKAEVEDERAEDGAKRVDKIIARADYATAYADMLGLGSANMNENNSFAETEVPAHDSETGEIAEPPPRDAVITTVEASAEMVEAIKANWTPDAGPMPEFLVRQKSTPSQERVRA